MSGQDDEGCNGNATCYLGTLLRMGAVVAGEAHVGGVPLPRNGPWQQREAVVVGGGGGRDGRGGGSVGDARGSVWCARGSRLF